MSEPDRREPEHSGAHRTVLPKTGFRYDIQALRAAAVALVVLNHLWPTRFPGGYVGVDVFFVISGYLITTHLRREADSTGRLRLARFWARRARRLLPAAFTTLMFTVIITVLWAPATMWQSSMAQIAAAGTYILNWVLAATSLNYFTADTAGSAVTHYWSLSVEEQFYIVWPLLFVVGLVLMKRAPRTRAKFMVATFSIVLVVSFVWALYSVRTEPSAAYFETTGRAWEFAAGGLLTFAPQLRRTVRLIPVTWVAWIAVVGSAFWLGPSSGVPGWWALLPVVATVVVIWIGDINHSLAPTGLTSLKPIQFLGDISYSLYLWHWPLIFIAPMILHATPTSLQRSLVLVISIAVAYLSKRFIEDPVRHSNKNLFTQPKWVLTLTAAGMGALLAVTMVVSTSFDWKVNSISERLYQMSMSAGDCFGAQAVLSGATCVNQHTVGNIDTALVDASHQIKRETNGHLCISSQGDAVVRSCSFGMKEGTQTVNVALVGDSHAEVWAATLAKIAGRNKLRITAYLQSGCPPTLDDDLKYQPATSPTIIDGCRTWRNSVIAEVANNSAIDVVVTTSKDRSYVRTDGRSDNGSGYVRAWERWLAAGKKVIVINDVPDYVRTIIPDCIIASNTRTDPCTMPANGPAAPSPLTTAAGLMSNPNFTYVDFEKVFCDAVLCHSVIGGIPAYIDPSHITAAFARSFSPEFIAMTALQG